MKKLTIAALALALSAGVNANPVASDSAEGTGAVNVAAVAAGVVGAAVVGGVISNNRKKTVVTEEVKPTPNPCGDDEGPDANGVCTNTTITVTVTGTGTATSTTTVPVVTTY